MSDIRVYIRDLVLGGPDRCAGCGGGLSKGARVVEVACESWCIPCAERLRQRLSKILEGGSRE